MKKILLSALALFGVGAMMPAEVSAQFRVVKDGKAILVMQEGTPDYVDFESDGPLTLEDLKSMTTITVDKASDGQNGNVLTCSTTAPVSVQWSVPDYRITSNSKVFTLKMGVGEHRVLLSAMCADGTKLNAEYTVTCDVETAAPEKVYIYGEDPVKEPPFTVYASAISGDLRFSDNEGNYFPYLSDHVYWGLKTLIFDISDTKPGEYILGDSYEERPTTMRVMNGWWSNVYADDVTITDGLWELPITEQIAQDCALGSGGRDLYLLLLAGSCTVNSVYYYDYVEEKPAITAGKAVDLGLSVMWSNCNIGASSPEQSGDYFAMGETATKDNYTWESYKYGGGFTGDRKITLEKTDDAAAAFWGGGWVIPSTVDWIELQNNCSFEWSYMYGFEGFVVVGTNGNSIFLPACGGYKSWNIYGVVNTGTVGYYWSSSLNEKDSRYGRYMHLSEYKYGADAYDNRADGYSVRPVCPSSGATNGYDAVDLGLPSGKLWATCNIGASAPDENGWYFV